MQPTPASHAPCMGPGVVPGGGAYAKVDRNPGTVGLGGYGAAFGGVNHTALTPAAGGAAFCVDPAVLADPHTRTQYPYVTGTSVLAVKYKDGVMLACDTLGSYGSTKRYKSVQRLQPVGKNTVIGGSGEYSDFAYILKLLDELTTDDYCLDDGQALRPKEISAYLTRVLYNRRTKMDPLWNSLVVAGVDSTSGEAFLGTVSMLGVQYSDSHVATGFGAHLARPLFREKQHDDMSEAEAKVLLEDALRVCYYRDKQSINKFQIATVTATGTTVSEPYALDTAWHYEAFKNPAAQAVGTW